MFALQVAVAVAIIKTKPGDTPADEYVRSLQSKFLLQQLQLGYDLVKAKQKILNLEEKLAEVKADPKERSLSYSDEAVEILTPPSSSSNPQLKTHSSNMPGGLSHNTETVALDIESARFTQSVMNLHNCCANPLQSQETVRLTAEENIHNLSAVLSCGVIALSKSSLCRAALAVAGMLHHYPCLQDCESTMKEICLLIESVLSRMKEPSNYRQLHPHRQKISLMHMLVSLTKESTTTLLSLILDSLMESWEEFCQALRDSRKTAVPINPKTFDSNYFVIHAIELIAKSWLEGQECVLDAATLSGLQDRLDRSLLHLTDHFPLVAHAVWKVTSLMETLLQASKNRL